MEALIFIYCIILLIIFTCGLCCTFYIYLKNKHMLFLALSIMLLFYLLDSTIIHMTEFLDSFSQHYNSLFMTVPAIKTVILIGTSLCYFYTFWILLQRKISNINYAPVVAHALILTFIPIIQGGALQVWLYYLPSQVFLFSLSLYTIIQIKKDPELYSNSIYNAIIKILIFAMIFCVLIVVEDTIVIFNYDVYGNAAIKIHNRSLTTDIMSVCFCLFIIRYSFLYDKNLSKNTIKTEIKTENFPFVDDISEPMDCSQEQYFTNFCQLYQLTERETELLKMLLDDKTNQEISEELYISIGTVKTHVHNIYHKVGTSKRNLLIRKYNNFLNQTV